MYLHLPRRPTVGFLGVRMIVEADRARPGRGSLGAVTKAVPLT
jgi:hypothetical protein